MLGGGGRGRRCSSTAQARGQGGSNWEGEARAMDPHPASSPRTHGARGMPATHGHGSPRIAACNSAGTRAAVVVRRSRTATLDEPGASGVRTPRLNWRCMLGCPTAHLAPKATSDPHPSPRSTHAHACSKAAKTESQRAKVRCARRACARVCVRAHVWRHEEGASALRQTNLQGHTRSGAVQVGVVHQLLHGLNDLLQHSTLGQASLEHGLHRGGGWGVGTHMVSTTGTPAGAH
jgi:hypothetical protein